MAFVFFWSTGYIGAEYTVRYCDPFYLLAIRGFISCIVFILLAYAMKVPWPDFPSARKQLFIGFMLQGMFMGGGYMAITQGMPSSIVALVVGLQPILTAIFVTLKDKQGLKFHQWLGIILGFIGVIFVLNPFESHGYALTLVSVMCAVVGLLGLTMGTIYQKRMTSNGHPITQVFYHHLALALSMSVVTLIFEDQNVTLNVQFMLGLAWLVLVIGLAAMVLLVYMIKQGESTKVATYFYLVPAFVAIEAWFMFDTVLTPIGLFGMGATIVGLVLVMQSDFTKFSRIFNKKS